MIESKTPNRERKSPARCARKKFATRRTHFSLARSRERDVPESYPAIHGAEPLHLRRGRVGAPRTSATRSVGASRARVPVTLIHENDLSRFLDRRFGETLIRAILLKVLSACPQRLKPQIRCGVCGTTKVVPFPFSIRRCRNSRNALGPHEKLEPQGTQGCTENPRRSVRNFVRNYLSGERWMIRLLRCLLRVALRPQRPVA